MSIAAQDQARVLIGAKIFLKADFDRLPIVRRSNVRLLASFINHGEGWRRVDKALLKDCMEHIIAKNKKPMKLRELLNFLVDRKIAYHGGLHRKKLPQIFVEAKSQFIHFPSEGYWPASLPYEARDYRGRTKGKTAQTHYIEAYGKLQSAQRKKRSGPVPPLPAPPPAAFTAWCRIRTQVCALERALRDLDVSMRQPQPVAVWLPGADDTGTTEQWLLYPSKLLRRVVEGILAQTEKPLGADAILERMILDKKALQSFNQRQLLTITLIRLKRCGELTYRSGQGYWLNHEGGGGLRSTDGEPVGHDIENRPGT